MQIEQSPIVKYIYNSTNSIGGYPMLEILNKEINKQNLLSVNNSEIGTKRFENLVIPAGLLSFSNEYYTKGGDIERKTKSTIKEKIHGAIESELFNKVFDLITKCPGKSRTRKNAEKISEKPSKKSTKKRILIKQ
jgi:hypothetical protein